MGKINNDQTSGIATFTRKLSNRIHIGFSSTYLHFFHILQLHNQKLKAAF